MPVDVIEIPNIRFELEQRSSKALRKFGNGRITIYLSNEPIWITKNTDNTHGIEWTWKDLLSFFTSNWAWIFNEQGLPLPIKYFPEPLAGSPSELIDIIFRKNGLQCTEENMRSLRTFCQRHDIAEATLGISLPSLFLLRIGNKMLFSSKRKQILVNIYSAYTILSRVGDIIYKWMLPYADEMTSPLLNAWKDRDNEARRAVSTKMHLLMRMKKDDFNTLTEKIKYHFDITWNGSILQESEIFAAARMSSGYVSINEQIDIITTILASHATGTNKLDDLCRCIEHTPTVFDDYTQQHAAYEQGYKVAKILWQCYCKNISERIDPEELLTYLGVNILETTWENTSLEAIACWSSNHGPVILLNTAEGKPCSHEYGRRFTLAHELCHLLIDRKHEFVLVDVLGGGTPGFIERRANAFAAEILLPRDLAAKEFKNSHESKENLLVRLRDSYKVPRKTVASQIFNSSAKEIMNSEEYEFFKKEVTDV